MTTIQPASPEPQATPFTFDYDAWIAEDAKRRAAFAEELIDLKASLFDALEAVGIILVTVAFDGCGDSGQIEDITAFDEHGVVALPEAGRPTSGDNPDAAVANKPQQIADAIETLAYDLLETEHGGWEIDGGAFGEFRFDILTRTIKLGCNIRFTSTEYSESNW